MREPELIEDGGTIYVHAGHRRRILDPYVLLCHGDQKDLQIIKSHIHEGVRLPDHLSHLKKDKDVRYHRRVSIRRRRGDILDDKKWLMFLILATAIVIDLFFITWLVKWE